eukprot:NODE_192_length_15450_cov_0.476355.p1 type:complete len:604 gc:universal NODE_192_length_15450_cov_0.476355:11634-9823(-)
MNKFYFTSIHFKSENVDCDKDLSWNIQRVAASTMKIDSNAKLIKSSTKAARSIVFVMQYDKELTNKKLLGNVKGLINGSAGVLSSCELDSHLQSSIVHKYNSLSHKESIKLNILTLPVSQKVHSIPNGVVLKVQYTSNQWKFAKDWSVIEEQMNELGMNPEFLNTQLFNIKGLCFDDDITFQVFVFHVLNKWYSAFIPKDEDMKSIKSGFNSPEMLIEIEAASKGYAAYCKSGDHFLTDSEIKRINDRYRAQCMVCNNKFVKLYSSIGDLRKRFIPTNAMKYLKFDWSICTSFDDLCTDINLSKQEFDVWKASHSRANFLTPVENVYEFIVDGLVDSNITATFRSLVNDGPFYRLVKDKYTDWENLTILDAFIVVFNGYSWGIEKSDIQYEIDNSVASETDGLYYRNHENCCKKEVPFLVDENNNNLIAFESQLKLEKDEEIVYNGSGKKTWLSWISKCSWNIESSIGGDFHSDESAIYFQRNSDDAKSWSIQKSNRGYYSIVASFAMKKSINTDKAYKMVSGKEWRNTILCYRLNTKKEIRKRKSWEIIEGEFRKNGGKVIEGKGSVRPQVDQEKKNQIFVKDILKFQTYFRYLGQRLIFHA